MFSRARFRPYVFPSVAPLHDFPRLFPAVCFTSGFRWSIVLFPIDCCYWLRHLLRFPDIITSVFLLFCFKWCLSLKFKLDALDNIPKLNKVSIRWNRELTLKCIKSKYYVKPMQDPLGVSPSKENQGTTRGKEKILLTSEGIEPTISGLDLPLLCRLSYEVGQRKSGTI